MWFDLAGQFNKQIESAITDRIRITMLNFEDYEKIYNLVEMLRLEEV
jgi:hypothetical protein